MNLPESSDAPIPRMPARRRSVQSKLMLVLAGLSVTILVFCCIPMVVIQIAIGPEMSTEPAKVLAVAHEIAPLVIPAKFQGNLARWADNSVLQLQIARFDQLEGRGRLVIGQLHFKSWGEIDPKTLQNFVDNLFPGQRLLDVKQTRKTTLKIHGQEVTLEIVEGEDRASTTRFKQVSGTYDGLAGVKVQLLLQAESDYVTDEAIDALLQSLAAPAAETKP